MWRHDNYERWWAPMVVPVTALIATVVTVVLVVR